jgi:hypothetical protein
MGNPASHPINWSIPFEHRGHICIRLARGAPMLHLPLLQACGAKEAKPVRSVWTLVMHGIDRVKIVTRHLRAQLRLSHAGTKAARNACTRDGRVQAAAWLRAAGGGGAAAGLRHLQVPVAGHALCSHLRGAACRKFLIWTESAAACNECAATLLIMLVGCFLPLDVHTSAPHGVGM